LVIALGWHPRRRRGGADGGGEGRGGRVTRIDCRRLHPRDWGGVESLLA
jgi:hypothetical protein